MEWSSPAEGRLTELTLEEASDVESLDLHDVLHDPYLAHLFGEHLLREYATENLEFWRVAERFRLETEEEALAREAQYIFDTWVSEEAKSNVNVSSSVREELQEKLDAVDISRDMFIAARDEVFALMQSDSFSRFIRSRNAALRLVGGDTVVKEGSLIKQGSKVKSWRKRYFVLRSKELIYGKDRDGKLDVKGSISLCGASVESGWMETTRERLLFRIYVPADDRTLLLSASSRDEVVEWMTAVEEVICKADLDASGKSRELLAFKLVDDFVPTCVITLPPEGSVLALPGTWVAKGESVKVEDVPRRRDLAFFLQRLTNSGAAPSSAVFTKPFAGKMIQLDLARHWSRALFANQNSLLCFAPDTDISPGFELVGGHLFARLKGNGNLVLKAAGGVFAVSVTSQLDIADVGYLVAFEACLSLQFGKGESVTLIGPGMAYLQTAIFAQGER